MTLITISREIGSNGTQIGKAVAAQLGAKVVNREVLEEMAQQMGVPVEVVIKAEGRLVTRPVGVSDEMRALFAAQRGAVGAMNEAQFIQQMIAAIKRLAAAGDAIIMGRGAQIVLKEHPSALHVHLYAPPQARAKRVQERRSLPNLEAATRLVQQVDEQHRTWFRHFFSGIDWKSSRHYNLMIDTARIPAEVAASLIVLAAKAQPAST
jgi:CMP/dCMP kinase